MNRETSLTDTAIQRFLKSEKNKFRAELACKNITGFHLQKLRKGGSFRLRYSDSDGNRKILNLGKYRKGFHVVYAEKAIEFLDGMKALGANGRIEITRPKLELVVTNKEAIAEPEESTNQKSDNFYESEKIPRQIFPKYPPIADDEATQYHFDRLVELLLESGFDVKIHHSESIGAWAETYVWYDHWRQEAKKGIFIEREGDRRRIQGMNPAFDKLKELEAKLVRYRKEFGVSGDAKQGEGEDQAMKEFMDMMKKRKERNSA